MGQGNPLLLCGNTSDKEPEPSPSFPTLTPQGGKPFQDSRASGPRLLPFRVMAAQSSLHSVCSSGSKAAKPSSAFLLHLTFSWPLSYTYVAPAENGSEKKPWAQAPQSSHWASQHLNPSTHTSTLRNPCYHANSLKRGLRNTLTQISFADSGGSGRLRNRVTKVTRLLGWGGKR